MERDRMGSLERFRRAQNEADSGFATALRELQTTGKREHWIWYVFPQLAGLGSSSMAREFAIAGSQEAEAYLRDPVLRARLIAASTAVDQWRDKSAPLERVMGSRIDALKLVSSLTLFEHIAQRLAGEDPGSREYSDLMAVAGRVLATAEEQGYARCRFTLDRLRAEGGVRSPPVGSTRSTPRGG